MKNDEGVMNTISQNLENLITSYRYGRLEEVIYPAVYIIEPTNFCNLNCIMCPNSKIQSKGFMDFDLFKNIIEQIKTKAKVIMLYNIGEPLLYEKIFEMIEYCKKNTEAKVYLSTNGTLLNEDISKKIIKSKLDEIIISLDGNSAQTYEKIRIGADFEKVNENILSFIKIRSDSIKPEISLQFIKMNLNKHEINEFKDKWKKLKCKVVLSNLKTWGHELSKFSKISNIQSSAVLSREPCADLWFTMTINHEGEVVSCCYDHTKKNLIGNLKECSVEDIWNNNKIKQLRKLQSGKEFSKIELCKNCYNWSNEIDEYEYFPEFLFSRAGRP